MCAGPKPAASVSPSAAARPAPSSPAASPSASVPVASPSPSARPQPGAQPPAQPAAQPAPVLATAPAPQPATAQLPSPPAAQPQPSPSAATAASTQPLPILASAQPPVPAVLPSPASVPVQMQPVSALVELFTQLQLSPYLPAFEREQCTINDLALLTAEQLRVLIPAMGPRARLENYIAENLKKATDPRAELKTPAASGFGAASPYAFAAPAPSGWMPALSPASVPFASAPQATPTLPATTSADDCARLSAEIGCPVIASSDLKFLEELGRGGFGVVYKALWVSRVQHVAVKVLHLNAQSLSQAALKEFREEAKMMRGLVSPYLLTLQGICIEPGRLCMVTELAANKSMWSILLSGQQLTWALRVRMAGEAARGLNHLHLHTPQILHRDIKSANLLVTESMHVKIGDFGLAKARMETTTTTALPTAISLRWSAPELLAFGGKHSTATDVFSFGVPCTSGCVSPPLVCAAIVLWEIAHPGDIPYGETSDSIIRDEVRKGSRLEIASWVPKPFADLIRRCWDQDPIRRPSMLHVIAALDDMSFASEDAAAAVVRTSPFAAAPVYSAPSIVITPSAASGAAPAALPSAAVEQAAATTTPPTPAPAPARPAAAEAALTAEEMSRQLAQLQSQLASLNARSTS